MHERCNHLEPSVPRESDPCYPTKGPKPTRVYATHLGVKCGLCDQDHFIHTCEQFLEASPTERNKIIRERRLCTNCLRKGHTPAKCRAGTCRVCQRRHHTLLHTDSITDQAPPQVNTTCLKTELEPRVLLATAVINILDRDGRLTPCRVLLDSCSQANFITTGFAKKLQLPTKQVNLPIAGMNKMTSHIKLRTTALVQSRTTGFSQTLDILIAEIISDLVPSQPLHRENIHIPREASGPGLSHTERD